MAQTQLPPSEERLRFLVELEFVQCLANPAYLNYLAQNEYLRDPDFVRYLAYLQYWKQPQYAKFLVYPQCLAFLDLLQHERFRTEIAKPECAEYLHRKQFYHWVYYRNKRSDSDYIAFDAAKAAAEATGIAGNAEIKVEKKEAVFL